MVNPIPAITACIGTALLIGVITKSAAEVGAFEIPDCDSLLDVLTGCDNAASKFTAYVILGTIPGAHPVVNAIMGVIGIALRATALYDFVNWLRGRAT